MSGNFFRSFIYLMSRLKYASACFVHSFLDFRLTRKGFDLSKYPSKIKKYHNRYSGKRCFVIGNGPSLTANDLNKIKGEYSFASNGIYGVYNKTEWRPSFYFCQDVHFTKTNIDTIRNIVKSNKFLCYLGKEYWDKTAIRFFVDNEDNQNGRPPRFSEDFSNCTHGGRTVTYSMIQAAVYMGFKEIYLLGVDSNYTMNDKGIDKSSYSADLQVDSSKFGGRPPDLEYTLLSYKKAHEYAKEHKINICNATRGGMLEAFPRVGFDDIKGI